VCNFYVTFQRFICSIYRQNSFQNKLHLQMNGNYVLSAFYRIIFTVLFIAFSVLETSAQMQLEKLDRGVVAVSMGGAKVFISWRWLGTEDNLTFNIYRNGTKINTAPLTVSNYTDNAGSTTASYTVTTIVNGIEQTASAGVKPWAQQYLKVPISAPPGGTTPTGEAYTYNANDASIADLDGDGEWEIILKWDPSNAKDNSQSGYTGNTYVDAYKMNGTRMWRIDFGRNIRSGAHYLDFMVYDFDGDGQAEMMARTAEATIDGTGVVIGNANADYRTTAGYILTGPEYITIFNGRTGKAMATKNLYPPRGNVADWGDNYGNRVDRFKACVAYLDGQRPSGVFIRGYYAKWGAEAIDWRNGQLTTRWTYMCPNDKTNPCYEEGAHSVSVADVDGDGKQEIITGSLILDDNGTMYYNTTIGHGDALHVSDMDPDLDGLEISHIQEPVGNAGLYMYSGKTKNVLWRKATAAGSTEGPGRGVCADISAAYRGAESWCAGGGISGVFDCKGNLTTLGAPQSCNFLAWWDGDLLRELLNNTMIDKFEAGRLLTAYNIAPIASNNGTKSTPCLSGDIMGDWREEVIWRAAANDALYIFTTTTPSTYKFRTLMHDPQYRVAIAWQNTGYNQPPHLSYYLGEGMATPAKPNISVITPANLSTCAATITSPSNSICENGSIVLSANAGTSYKWFNGTTQVSNTSTYTAITAGNYTVEVTGASGCKATSAIKTITVNPLPVITSYVQIDAGAWLTASTASVCEGSTINLGPQPNLAAGWSWTGPNNFTSTLRNPILSNVVVANAGNYIASYTDGNGCKATSTFVLQITKPVATITSPSNAFCAGGSVVLTSSAATSYKWFNGTTQVGTASTHTVTTAGDYTVEVTNTSGCKNTSEIKNITVNPLPVITPYTKIDAGAWTSVNTVTTCEGSTLNLGPQPNLAAGWSWTGPNNFTSSLRDPILTNLVVANAGNYIAAYTDPNGCKATSNFTVQVSKPTASITSPTTSFCVGGSIALTANAGTSYKWFNGTTQVGTASIYTATTSGTYTVEVTNASGCSSTSSAKQISEIATITWYADMDNDGVGDIYNTLNACSKPNGYVATAGDACPTDANKTAAGNCGCGNTEASCLDCNNTPNGTAVIDNCNICTGGTTGNTACVTTATLNGTSMNIQVVPQPFDANTTIKVDNLGMIQSFTIISSSGAHVDSKQGLNTDVITIGDSISSGLYTVIITTDKGIYTTKIVKW
jgi:hypothetical protein